MKKLKGKNAVVNNLLANDPNWKSPVQAEPKGESIISLAQYMNKHGAVPAGLKVKAEVGGMGWVDAVIHSIDIEKDIKDRYNMGYWHNSRANVIILFTNFLNRQNMHKIPFSMIMVDLNNS